MRKSLVVGLLKETRGDQEKRTPLTPEDVSWLIHRGIDVEVEMSPARVFKDEAYRKRGARMVKCLKRASLLLGIKAPSPKELYREKVYMIFSHKLKGQPQNRPFLREFIRKKNTLIDYEKIVDVSGKRLVYFGRYAGICGMIDSLYYLGKRLEHKGIPNPFTALKPAHRYRSLKEAKRHMAEVGKEIKGRGLDERLTPFIIGITGHGNVSRGAQEILDFLGPVEVHPRDMRTFIRHQRYVHNRVYKIVFFREEKLRSKTGKAFYFEEYLKHPERFESNMDQYLSDLNLLVNGSYWDRRYPRLVTEKMIQKLYGKNFRLEFIGDISCDIDGSIEITKKAATAEDPTFTYNPKNRRITDGYKGEGITVLAIDNLPSELPKDSSTEFSKLVREYVYQVAAHGKKDIIHHMAIPREVRDAVVIQDGDLTERYKYLKRYA